MRFHALRTQTNDIRLGLSSGHLGTITHGLFKILTNNTKTDVAFYRKTPVYKIKKSEEDELRSLENCANAARETEALGQFE